MNRWLKRIGALALFSQIYVVMILLSAALAIPPAYTPPLLFPTGFGLACILIFGRWVALGVWIGSVTLYFWTLLPLVHNLMVINNILPTYVIGVGAALQTLVGEFLVRRFGNFPSALTRASQVLRFLFFAGPVACLILALHVSVSLYLKGAVAPSTVVSFFLKWWMGGTAGVLLVTPAMLALARVPRNAWPDRRRVLVLVPVLFVFIGNVLLFISASRWQEKRMRLEFGKAAGTVTDGIRHHFVGLLDCLYALENVVSIRPGLRYEDFFKVAQGWIHRYSELDELAWIPRQNMEKDRREGLSGYFVKASVKRLVYGEELLSENDRQQAWERARDSGQPTATAPIRFSLRDGSNHDTFGVTVMLPVYSEDSPTVEARRRNLTGFVSATFRMDEIILASLVGSQSQEFRVSIRDPLAPTGFPGKLRAHPPSVPGAPAARWDFSDEQDNWGWTSTVRLANRSYVLRLSPSLSYLAALSPLNTWLLLAAESLLSGMLVAFLLIITGHGLSVETALRERRRITEKLERSNADLEHFAYAASHDMKEPLRTISLFAQLLRERYQGKLDADADTYLGFVVDSVKRMYALLDSLLAYSRLDQREPTFERVDAKAALEVAIRNLGLTEAERTAMIEYDTLPHVWANQGQLIQLFQNLVGNALKYRGNDQPKIQVRAEVQGASWVFSVRDNGIGIDPQYSERIFGLFQRLHGREKFSGSGLGLAICKRIILGYGGRIWVESQLGRGACFFFTLPFQPV